MDMYELFSTEDFRDARAAKLVNLRGSDFGLNILNYSDAAMYTPGGFAAEEGTE